MLHLKKERSAKDKPFEEQASRDSSYMQLTIGRKVMVYDLQASELSEVAMIQVQNKFTGSPITFSHSGFVLNVKEQSFDTNLSASIGV